MNRWIRRINHIFALPVHLYRWVLSPILPPSCIYHPSCSKYALDSILLFGPLKGYLLAILRILRCNTLFLGGADEVEADLTVIRALKKYGEHSRFNSK